MPKKVMVYSLELRDRVHYNGDVLLMPGGDLVVFVPTIKGGRSCDACVFNPPNAHVLRAPSLECNPDEEYDTPFCSRSSYWEYFTELQPGNTYYKWSVVRYDNTFYQVLPVEYNRAKCARCEFHHYCSIDNPLGDDCVFGLTSNVLVRLEIPRSGLSKILELTGLNRGKISIRRGG